MKTKGKILVLAAALLSVLTTAAQAQSGKITVARAFYELARQNNISKIESLLDRGYSLESVDERGYNPVCLAVIKQDRSAYRTLTSYGANRSPNCLQKIPESAYKRFFGVYPTKAAPVTSYVSDTPYLIGAAVLGAGAIATAYILRGDTDKDGSSPEPGPGPDPDPQTCPNGTYNKTTKHCDCNTGYGNYGDDSACYKTVDNCIEQNKATCKTCKTTYHLKDNICYAPIANCQTQDGGICKKCYSGFGVHGGDGTYCYRDIEHCKTQVEDTCSECVSGYGTHGDNSQCYKNIAHCSTQVQTACSHCEQGYDTFDNPAKDVCYPIEENPCKEYANTYPVKEGDTVKCVCNENKGYYGEPGSCTQSAEGDYHEGDGDQEEWNNLNEIYCHSHGKYDTVSQLCTCYRGYANSTNGCSTCAENYVEFGGRCYQNLNCAARGEGYVQAENKCVCDAGYFEYDGACTAVVTCPIHQRQIAPGPDIEQACQCKENFNEECTACEEDYTLDVAADECIKTQTECEEEWRGNNCDICPKQYEVTTDGSGKKHCGNKCAANRKPIEEDSTCMSCMAGFEYSSIDDNCIVTGCSQELPGYVRNEEGYCVCDAENNYYMNPIGECIHKKDPLIGMQDSNINNSTIEVTNDGTDTPLRDVYGMKPVMINEDEEEEYYPDIYNAKSASGEETGIIRITNANTGQNEVFGMYSPYKIYNAAAINANGQNEVVANGNIEINDLNTSSNIYGIMNNSSESILNAYAYNGSQAEAINMTKSIAHAVISISKDENGKGSIIGIKGLGDIFNANAYTMNGTAANVNASGSINLTNNGQGNVYGIVGGEGKVTNAKAFLDSAISDAIAIGEIKVAGLGDVYGILSNGSITNSETQFNKSFNKVNNFTAQGTIEATAHSDAGTAYGMVVAQKGNNQDEDIESSKITVYNAMGYNSKSNILIQNDKGGSGYGIVHNVKLYEEQQAGDENPISYYNNTYNAFRSSAKYGGDDVAAEGTIKLEFSGNSNADQNGVGIYASGNVFNAYANSGSEVKLESIGNIIIDDKSTSSNMVLKGIESGGATIANAFATGMDDNEDTVVTGNIKLNILNSKEGSGSGAAVGIYSTEKSDQVAQIYNAALIQDKSNVEGNITIVASTSPYSQMYGIYAVKQPEGQEKTIYNAYYANTDEDKYEGSVYGTINITAPKNSTGSTAEYYGIYINGGAAYNVYTTNQDADVKGKINVNVAGGENSGIAVGMYGNNASLYNSGANSIINVSTTRSGSKAFGMKGDNAYIENSGTITVSSEKSEAYGLYTNQGQVINAAGGVLNVSGKTGSYGIYAIAVDDHGIEQGSARAINNGTINLTGTGKNVGIYASGTNVTVENHGTININGSEYTNVCIGSDCENDVAIQLDNGAIRLLNGAQMVNSGNISSTGSLNLSAMGDNIIIEKGGKFEAEDAISGGLQVSKNTLSDTFEKQIFLEDALSANDISNVNVTSQSYLYDTNVAANNNGKYDIVANIKDFAEVTDNSSEATYLENNYNNAKNMALFNALKSASTAASLKQIKADTMGSSMLPNITEEELKVQRHLDKTMTSDLFNNTTEDVRKFVGGDATYAGRDDHGTLTGYDITSKSIYTLYDKKLDNRYRLGLGLSITDTDTDYNNDSTRKNMIIQGYVPLTYNNGRLTAVSMARLGYADGEYKRHGHDKTYKADTSEITYGLLNEARYKNDMGYFNLTPFVGLNAIGWYMDSVNEGKDDLALRLDSSNVFSLESALGIYVDKEIEFNQDNILSMALGLGWYHEFADPYKGFDARHANSLGKYRLKNKINSRDRGILSAKVDYDYKNFSIYGEIMQYLEKEYPIEVEGGLKYRF